MQGLSQHAKKFAEFLFVRHPDWQQFASVENPSSEQPDRETGALIVSVPARPGFLRDDLAIEANSEEVVVVYDTRGHRQFAWINESGAEVVMQVALDFIDDVLAERVVFAYEKHRLLFWRWETPIEIKPTELTTKRRQRLRLVRSWNGSYDWDSEM